MKGKKMVFAVMLSLIVCLLLVPTCAYATEVESTPENSDVVALPTVPDGDTFKVPAAPAVIGDLDDDDTAAAPDGGDDGDDELIPDTDEDEGGEDSTIPGKDDDTEKEPGSDEEGESKIPGDSDDDDEDDDKDENNADKDKPANNGGSDSVIPSDTTTSGNGGNTNNGFQVELTYNDKVVKKDGLKGGESFDLAELLHELGIDGELTEAKGNADDLFDAVKGEDGWKFNTKMAFGDPFELVVTVDGVQYVITVTDEGSVKEIANGGELKDALGTGYLPNVTLKLTSDCTTPTDDAFKIEQGKTVIIDLNGYSLKSYDSSVINNCSNLRIIDSSANKTGKLITSGKNIYQLVIKNYETGIVTLEGGTLLSENHLSKYLIDNLGQMTIKSGVVVESNYNGSATIYNGGTSYPNATMTIEGGQFSNSNGKLIQNAGKLEIQDGEFTGTIPDTMKNTTIKGGEFTDKNVEKYVGDNDILVKSGNKYAVNESAYDIAKEGETLEIVKAPANTKIDNAPAGVTVKNSTGNTIIINGVEIKNDETVVTVAPATKSAVATNSCDIPMFKYCVVDGKDAEWTKGSAESLNYVLNADANNLVKVLIDGEEVEFEIDENGEVVISAEVLEKLDAGEYEIEFIFADGSCKTKLFVK